MRTATRQDLNSLLFLLFGLNSLPCSNRYGIMGCKAVLPSICNACLVGELFQYWQHYKSKDNQDCSSITQVVGKAGIELLLTMV